MRCYFHWDDKTKQNILIPGCYGSLHRDDLSNCCCPKPQKTLKQFEKEEYNKVIGELRRENAHILSEYNKLLRIVEKIHLKSIKGRE